MEASEREHDSDVSPYLQGLTPEDRRALLQRLWDQQSGVCYLSGEPIDLDSEADALDIEHIEPLRDGGNDEESNLALVKRVANEGRQAGDLRVARILARFDQSRSVNRNEPKFARPVVVKDADTEPDDDGAVAEEAAGEMEDVPSDADSHGTNGHDASIDFAVPVGDVTDDTEGVDDARADPEPSDETSDDAQDEAAGGNAEPRLSLGSIFESEGRFAGPGKLPKLRPLIGERRLITDGRPADERKITREKPVISPRSRPSTPLKAVRPPESLNLPAAAPSTNLVPKRRVSKLDRIFDQLRLRLVAGAPAANERDGALVLAFTSRTRGEGVSTVAGGIARSFSRAGSDRTLLIDADETENGLAKRMPGNDFTSYEDTSVLDPDRPIGRVDAWGVDGLVLAANGAGGFPYDTDWEAYLSGLRARYDTIVVDAGSLQDASPYHWAPMIDQFILVVDAGSTTTFALERLRRELERSSMEISGVILNKREFPIPGFLY